MYNKHIIPIHRNTHHTLKAEKLLFAYGFATCLPSDIRCQETSRFQGRYHWQETHIQRSQHLKRQNRRFDHRVQHSCANKVENYEGNECALRSGTRGLEPGFAWTSL